MCFGEHSSASLDIIKDTTLATSEEYKYTYEVLENLGYNLRVMSKVTNKHLLQRHKQLEKIYASDNLEDTEC
jgi:hypothetical protein